MGVTECFIGRVDGESGGTAKTCSSPLPIPNGVVDVPPGSKLAVNTKAEYRCNTGYQLVGVAERFCQMDGTWSGQEPYCQAAFPTTTCPPLGPIVHGEVTVEAGPIHVNTRAEYRCDIDYTLIGDKERFCQLNGTWSGKEPICHDANADTCPAPPPIANGAFDIAPGPIVVRTRIEYRCNAGYALVGQKERVCQLDGSWTGTAPVCQVSCPRPSPIANGDISVPGGAILPNTPVQYSCNPGYTLIGMQVRLCKADGTWSGTEPFCQSGTGPRNCPAPTPIANGDVDVPPGPLVANTRVLYRCNAGYTLIGPSERLCKPDGTWTGAQPVCQSGSGPRICPAPGSIPNGAVDLPSGTLVVNTRVQYRCNAGYTLIGTMERVCQPDGSWSGTEPVCQAAAPSPTTCPAPGPIANGAVDVPPGKLVVNTKVQYRCNAGYTLVGMTERICQADGSWSNTEPMCQGSPPPAGEDKTTAQPDNSNEAQMTSWVLLALMAILVVAGAVVLYMAYQFYCKGRPDRASISSATRTQ
ncbi:CUB and sushi domain-containing protein 2 [Rhipicephalus sanguineus]|uniref:CUB and sushi domain-containing protein 2 n=1 Tax=Rhipicephalus sanguineus TaxID=34632 RepID=UPI001893D15A|nr:CUB and sushi domain-containing protein 2 [Rhipicephalus sanguineus]